MNTRGPDGRRFGAGDSGGGGREFLKGKGFATVGEVEVMPENVRFGLPPEIVEAIAAAPAAAE